MDLTGNGRTWPTRSGLTLVGPLLVAVVCLLAAGAPGVAAAATGVTARSGPVLAPRGGQLVRSDQVRIAVRSGDEPGALTTRLNGRQIGGDFGLARRGVRSLVASVSEGLRRGKNVLNVTVHRVGARPLSSTVRFTVRTNRPLVGAGIDQRVVVGEKIKLDGLVVPASGGARPRTTRWRLVKRETTPSAVSAARLSHPARVRAGFRAMAPGEYTLQLSAQPAGGPRSVTAAAASGTRPTSDSVTLSVLPPNPLVAVDTIVRSDDKPGIQVGGTTYPATEPQSRPAAFVQVLVLDRRTLGEVSNDSYSDTDALEAALGKLDASKLVVAVLQKAGPGAGTGGLTGKDSLVQALAPIGFPALADVSKTPLGGGDLSAIGVPKTNPGDADVHANATGGEMQGYLTPDQWRNYGFTSPTQTPFDFPPEPISSARPATAGFVVTDYDGITGAIRDQKVFTTNGDPPIDSALGAVKDMSTFITGIPTGDPVSIRSFSNASEGSGRLPLLRVGAVDTSSMGNLAGAVAGLGGSRNGINTVMFPEGPSSGTPMYALMGWAGAGEGNGQEVSLGVDGAEDRAALPELSGVLRRDSQYRLRPVEVTTSGQVSDTLQQLVVQKPGSEAWPLENDPAEMRALAYLGDQDNRLGSDPRAAYWTHEGDESEWNNIAAKIRDVVYPNGKEDQFTLAQFRQARNELVKELRWVGRVRGYLKVLSSPFSSGTALREWADVQNIADQVHLDGLDPNTGVSVRWLQFTSILLKALGPFTSGVTTVFSASLDFGVWLAGANPDGTPGYDAFHVTADQLGSTVVDQALNAQATYESMGDIIVSDYHKLRVLGENGGCNPNASGCEKDFAFTKDDKAKSVAGVYRAVERLAYEKFVPLAERVYQLNTEPDFLPDPSRPPELGRYRCGEVIHFTPFTPDRNFSPLTTVSLMQQLDSAHRIDNRWDTFVIGSAHKDGNYGIGPPPSLVKRMFDPIPDSLNPKEGGLGISPTQLMTTAKHWGWENPDRPGQDDCDFKG